MAKWADYGISAGRYNSAHTHVDMGFQYITKGEEKCLGTQLVLFL